MYVDELEIDDYNTAEMARHRVSPRDVRQVLNNAPRFFRNKKGRSATQVMIGPTDGGRMLTVPLARPPSEVCGVRPLRLMPGEQISRGTMHEASQEYEQRELTL